MKNNALVFCVFFIVLVAASAKSTTKDAKTDKSKSVSMTPTTGAGKDYNKIISM